MGRTKKEYPIQVEEYNTLTKNAWWKSKKVNPTSRKNAIRTMCLLCVGGSVKEVKLCAAEECPLHQFRITG